MKATTKMKRPQPHSYSDWSNASFVKYPCHYCGINIANDPHLHEHRSKCLGARNMFTEPGLPNLPAFSPTAKYLQSSRQYHGICNRFWKHLKNHKDLYMNLSMNPIKSIVQGENLVRQRSYRRCSGEYVHHRVCYVNIQSALHENVAFSVCVCLGVVFIFVVIFIFEVVFIFEVIFILRSSSQFNQLIDQVFLLQHQYPSWNTWMWLLWWLYVCWLVYMTQAKFQFPI